jgi:hypothetical protein
MTLSVDTARRLRAAGLTWSPAAGDRFAVPDRDLDDQVFVISEMVIEHHRAPTGDLLRFNGTTEWALDSLQVREALWLPREDQLRGRLGEDFATLEREPAGWAVSLTDGSRYLRAAAEEAYAAALLDRLPHAAR